MGLNEAHKGWTLDYRKSLSSIAESLPCGVTAFALCDWYYDLTDHRCPHDTWLEELAIIEPATGDRNEHRGIEIRLRLLGAYHDGHVFFRYRNVRRYCLETAKEYKLSPLQAGHGDFLFDEIRISQAGFVEQEIEFSRGSRFIIESSDIEFEFR